MEGCTCVCKSGVLNIVHHEDIEEVPTRARNGFTSAPKDVDDQSCARN
jgi:hypothetical protein